MSVEKKITTVAEYEQFIRLPENRDRRFELIDGEIVAVSPTEEHGTIISLLTIHAGGYVLRNRLGRWSVETRYRMPNDDANARIPDASFTSSARLQPVVKRGAVPHMPDLAVEVRSPDDDLDDLRAKVAYDLANGSRLAWLLLPEDEAIEVHQPGEPVVVLSRDDTLTGGAVLPGFALPVRALFDLG